MCFMLVSKPAFEIVVTVLIVLNTLVLALHYYNEPDDQTRALYIANIIFVILFTIEAVMKLLAWGFRGYFSSKWNRFDFCVVLVSLPGLFLAGGAAASVVRVLRVGRFLCL